MLNPKSSKNTLNLRRFLFFFFGILFLSSPFLINAQTVAELQAQIQAILNQINSLQQQLNQLPGSSSGSLNCVIISKNLYSGLKDSTTGGEVSKLQRFLKSQGDFTYSEITGYFGLVTQTAVQKFQKRKGIVSSGTPSSTGYGSVGPRTREAIKNASCGQTQPLPTPLPPQAGLTIGCAVTPIKAIVGQPVTWTAVAKGGTEPYAYKWSGTNSLTGNASSVTKTYTTTGAKSASVVINGKSKSCSNSVSVSPTLPSSNLSVSCKPLPTSANVGSYFTWLAAIFGGSPPYNISWTGADSLAGNTNPIMIGYSSAGVKNAKVTVNGQQFTCTNATAKAITSPPPPPNQPLTFSISCSGAPSAIGSGQSVTWTAIATGGTRPYSYLWSGTDSLSGSASRVVKTYTLTGSKTASVRVNGVTRDCSNNVVVTQTPPPPQPLAITCNGIPATANTGDIITWSATVSGGTSPYTFAWNGTDNLSGSTNPVTKEYSSAGTKTANVVVNNQNFSCASVTITSSAPALVWPPAGLTERKIFAYFWQWWNVPSSLTNIVPTHSVGWPNGGGYTDNPVGQAVSEALSHLSQTPAGNRVIFPGSAHDWMFFYKNLQTGKWSDAVQNPDQTIRTISVHPCDLTIRYFFRHIVPGLVETCDSQPNKDTYRIDNVPVPSVWWENGKNFTRDWFNQFFSQYKDQGGGLDAIITDTEEIYYYGAWSFFKTHQRCLADRANCPVSWCEALEQDPRWPPAGFPSQLLDNSDPTHPNRISTTVCGNDFINYYLRFDNWVLGRIDTNITDSIYNVARQYFPSVKESDYEMFHWSSGHPVPYGRTPYYLEGSGNHVGTHQSPQIYGNLHTEANLALSPPYGPNIPNYSQTSYNAFRMAVNVIRGAYLSSPSVKLFPWIANKNLSESLLSSSDLYQEMLLHAGMTNTDKFILWTWSTPPEGSQLINDVITELNSMVGYQGVLPVVNDIVPWTQDWVLTGARVGTYKVWRFTPETMSGSLISSGNSGATAPVIFSVNGQTITIPNATIWEPQNPVSSQGYWIIQAPNAPSPFFSMTNQNRSFASVWIVLRNSIAVVFTAILRFFGKGL